MTPETILIVGASLAGVRAAEEIRREGFDKTIVIVGDEPRRPYDRPPLSKQVLAGEWEPDRADLRSDDAYDALELDWRLGVTATALDVGGRRVTLDDGSAVDFDGLVIATGARCRTLPGTEDMDGVFVLRDMGDCLAIRHELEATPQRVAVVGAGFIGAEVAATARQRGLDVTVIEPLPAPVMRGLGAEMGAVCADVHRDHGVDVRLGVGVDAVEGDGRAERLRLSDGSVVDADVVVVGIGVVPNTEWLAGSGLQIDDGVVCDATCLAAPGIVAAGDVARWPNQRFDEVMRIEHWDNAVEQGGYAGRRLLVGDGDVEPFTPVPYFWSDQFDRKIMLAGRSAGYDQVEVVTGSTEERRFAAAYRRNGHIVGILGFNRPRHVMQYRQLIDRGATWDEAMAFAREQG